MNQRLVFEHHECGHSFTQLGFWNPVLLALDLEEC